MKLRNIAAHVHAGVVLHQAMLICCRAPHKFCLKRQGTGDTPQQSEAAFMVHWPCEAAYASGTNGMQVSCGNFWDRHSHQGKGVA